MTNDGLLPLAPGDAGGPRRSRPRRRSTIRVRLTVFYGVVFALCGLALTLVGYLMVRESLSRDEGTSNQRVIESYGYSRQQVDLFYKLPVPPASTGRPASNVGDVIVGVQQDIRDDALHQLLIGSSVALGLMVVVAVGVGWFAAGRALRPVGRITARAQQLSEDNLHERLSFEGPHDELKELADTLDGMLERLDRSFSAQRSFAANVSHELRTPLAVLQGEADLVLDQPDASERERRLAEAVRQQAGRSEALLDALLALARSESTMSERDRVDLADIAGEVVAERVDAADRAGIHVDLELDEASVDGDRWLLERLVANLVDNAIKYGTDGGWLRVAVARRGDRAVLEASNTGARLTDDQVDDLLQPFRRAGGDARPGYGLGMAIVVSVVRAHGGTLAVAARDEGGLDVVVSLPSAGGRPATPAPGRSPEAPAAPSGPPPAPPRSGADVGAVPLAR
ncbi:MAG: HAMP domain-containing sensor histidine kinase [Acidimicrobiales bacterium]